MFFEALPGLLFIIQMIRHAPPLKPYMKGTAMKLYCLPTTWCDVEVLEHEGKYAIIDTGDARQEESIRQYLNALNIQKVEWILITHFHLDHYGLLEKFVKDFEVGTVYFKEFSGYVTTDGGGRPCDDAALAKEKENCRRIKEICSAYSHVVEVETIKEIPFGPYTLKLFGNENIIEEVYTATGEKSTNENLNSLIAYMEVGSRSILLGGDVTDYETPFPQTSFQGTRFAREIGHSVDICKAPHHGVGIGTPETLSIYLPTYIYITNFEDTVRTRTKTMELLAEYVPDADVTFATDGGRVFTINDDGTITKEVFTA